MLLCCDGLSNAISETELASLIAEHTPPMACEHLIALANERGGADNLTAVVAWFDGDGLELPTASEPIGDRT